MFIIKSGSCYEWFSSFKLCISFWLDLGSNFVFCGLNNIEIFKLSDGDIYKIVVMEMGMYKLIYIFFRDELGMDIDNIDLAWI